MYKNLWPSSRCRCAKVENAVVMIDSPISETVLLKTKRLRRKSFKLLFMGLPMNSESMASFGVDQLA